MRSINGCLVGVNVSHTHTHTHTQISKGAASTLNSGTVKTITRGVNIENANFESKDLSVRLSLILFHFAHVMIGYMHMIEVGRSRPSTDRPTPPHPAPNIRPQYPTERELSAVVDPGRKLSRGQVGVGLLL